MIIYLSLILILINYLSVHETGTHLHMRTVLKAKLTAMPFLKTKRSQILVHTFYFSYS